MLRLHWLAEPSSAPLSVLAATTSQADALLTERFGAAVAEAAKAARFEGKATQSFAFTTVGEQGLVHHVVLGIGPLEAAREGRTFRRLAYRASRSAGQLGLNRLELDLRPIEADVPEPLRARLGGLLAQGASAGTYAYDHYIAEEDRRPNPLEQLDVVSTLEGADTETSRGLGIAAGVATARDLANGPAELVTPTFLAQTAERLARELGDEVELKVLERAECEARGMGAYLGVAKGSDEPPKFVHLTYRPKGGSTRGRVVLVGKGVTFDSGGYSIKPTDGMLGMKLDMHGAASVLGAFEAAVRVGVPYELHAITAATENMVSGHAYRLGDVLRASNGTTIEINNTDAEGRLTLADAIVYAGQLEPDVIIDLATLTGACIVALGPQIAGLMTEDDALASRLLESAEAVGEDLWRLPLPDHLEYMLESKIADCRNTGERGGGALTAGLFLRRFVPENVRWAHIDIAGPAMSDKPFDIHHTQGTGFGVALLVELLARGSV